MSSNCPIFPDDSHSAEKAIAESEKELTKAAVKVKAKSKEVTEEAVTKAKELLDKAEGLLAKIK